ncbi:redoxin domain-containing protein [Sulfitobacter sp. JBTF-M27]|uniref:Glutathione peroxidase n=2 Tax=Sulfitobacter sediminilitoris TaxID=2698830 RepID=A0A6P0C6E8_9RHOB|nr:glutathione peroxidase [Sulfitobacter sediminilitoris]NEK21729.1 redoxin domain-containing protein [Sulfitobacter sediminilitoris]
MMRWIVVALTLILGSTAMAAPKNVTFSNIDGGTLDFSEWAGKPVLVVNTASQCGFTRQYDGLQKLYDTYRARGLVVLAVPSDDFNQELESAEAVKDFCEITFGLDLPMTDITPVRGSDAHPFYQAVKAETGFSPKWNFNKVLIGPDGSVAGTWGATTKPTSRSITKAIEALLD